MPNGELIEKGNGLITTIVHDIAVMRISRLSVAVGKGRAASFREAAYYKTSSEKLSRLNKR